MMTSSQYPQPNGHAEDAVKAVMHLVLKTVPSGNINCDEFDRGLIELPAQILCGHPLCSCVPAYPESFSKERQARTEDCDHRVLSKSSTKTMNMPISFSD